MDGLDALECTVHSVLDEGRGLVGDKYFDENQEIYFNERMENTEETLKALQENLQKEQQR